MQTLHDVRSLSKIEELTESMERNGWLGAPLVADGERLVTGAHRHWAWTRALGRGEYEIPVIDVRDVFAEAGLDYDSLAADADDWYVRLVEAVAQLPAEIAEKYGMDVR